ncbi:MAG: hypothetical protein R8G66_22250 [Cytophagales bacterium]|nr:hypothetical protein [Cytophagales bacterium]
MRIKFSTISKHLLWCICLVVFTSCQNDDQNDPTPLSQKDYATYESNLLGHMRHFGEQIRSSSSFGFDDESLKSISSSYFEGDDHTAFVDAIDNPDTSPITGTLKDKVDNLHDAIPDHADHTSYLTYLSGELSTELVSESLSTEEKEGLLNHIVHLRVMTQFLADYQDLFTDNPTSGRVENDEWWPSTGQCMLSAAGQQTSNSLDKTNIGDGETTGSLTQALKSAKTSCKNNNPLFLAAFEFFGNLQTKPYCDGATTCDETNSYNMYSYAHLVSDGNGTYTPEEGKSPPVQAIDDFAVPTNIDQSSIALTFNEEGPYVGKTTDDEYFAFTDCSGFVSYILYQTDKSAFDEIMNNLPDAESHLPYCPSAAQFASFQPLMGGSWTKVFGDDGEVDFSLIQPGDIIAWDEDLDHDGDTGHVMIAAGPSRAIDTGCYYLVDIIDSTVIGHLNDDRVGIEKNNDATGVGLGTIGLKVDQGQLQSNFFPNNTDCDGGTDPWFSHPNISILRLKSSS